mmetsp:Transcript_15665/g.34049  ORF Transcript_15665/g.34049 Transcript_15665/m.34049 type:complete len:89 (+) Transcript_15665:493-759(+)
MAVLGSQMERLEPCRVWKIGCQACRNQQLTDMVVPCTGSMVQRRGSVLVQMVGISSISTTQQPVDDIGTTRSGGNGQQALAVSSVQIV